MRHLDCLIPWIEAGGVSYRLNKIISTKDLIVPLQHQIASVMLNWSVEQGAEMLRGGGRRGEIKCLYLLAVSQFIENCFSYPLLVIVVLEVCLWILQTLNPACPLADRVETLSCSGPKVVRLCKDDGRVLRKTSQGMHMKMAAGWVTRAP